MIAVFLFPRQFRRYAILLVKPTAYGIPFFGTLSWCLRVVGLWAELWFVVMCCSVKQRVRQKYSEYYFNIGIIALEISRACPTTTVIFSCILDIGYRLLPRVLRYVYRGFGELVQPPVTHTQTQQMGHKRHFCGLRIIRYCESLAPRNNEHKQLAESLICLRTALSLSHNYHFAWGISTT